MADPAFDEAFDADDSNSSGIHWGAAIAGAFVAAASSLALLTLGTGIGFSAISPWSNAGAEASAIGWTAIIWLVLMQIIASSVGGYLAGRICSPKTLLMDATYTFRERPKMLPWQHTDRRSIAYFIGLGCRRRP